MLIRKVGAVAFALAVASCSSSTSSTSTNGAGLDAGKMQTFMSHNLANVTIVYDGLTRIIAAASGSPTSGVTFTDIPGGVQGTVGYDLDHNGSMESSISGKLIYNDPAVGINSGATFTVSEINAPYMSGNATAVLAISGGGTQVNITSGSANFVPTFGPKLAISSVSLAVTPTLQNAKILGHADFSADNTTGTMFFENDGSGGWRVRVTGNGFATFTVP